MADSDSEVQFNFDRTRAETTVEENQPETVRPNYTVVDDLDEPDETDREAMGATREYDTPERDDPPAHSTPVAARGECEDIRDERYKGKRSLHRADQPIGEEVTALDVVKVTMEEGETLAQFQTAWNVRLDWTETNPEHLAEGLQMRR